MRLTFLGRRQLPIVALLTILVLMGAMLVTGSGEAPPPVALTSTPIPTVAYLPPTVVPTPANTPRPAPTQTPATASAPPAPRQPPAPPPPGPAPVGGVPQVYGQLILVSLSQQWLWAYQDMQLWYDTPVTSGRPELATPDGTFYLMQTLYNVTFYSPWPSTSPYYYAPEHINYALQYTNDGYFIHDAPWRQTFGPGTNYPHIEPNGTQSTGSHGCVNVPTSAGAWLANWTQVGATIVIYGTAPLPPPATPTATPVSQPTATSTPSPTPAPPPTPTPTPALPPTPTPTPGK